MILFDCIHTWRNRIVVALADEAQVVVDLIPQLEKVIGCQPPVLALPPAANAHRYSP